MRISKEELVIRIETARQNLNQSIDAEIQYDEIYKNSIELDHLIELYIASGF